MSLKLKITQAVGKQLLSAKTHSPVLLFGVGIVGFVGTTVLATRATLKLDELVLDEAEADIERIKEATVTASGAEYTEKDRTKDLRKVYIRSAVKIARAYAPAVAVGVISIAALTGSHVILTKRNTGLAAAYATVEKAFNQYRERVIADVGEEKDREYRHGVVERQIAVDTDTGVDVKTIKSFDPDGVSGYARVFAKGKSKFWRSVPQDNRMFLEMRQRFMNDKLQLDGYLFLNDVYKELGFPETAASRQVGWVLGEGDDHVSFGCFDRDSDATVEFFNGTENTVLLDFNCSGNIMHRAPLASDVDVDAQLV
jgi:hypothetical protein